MKRIINAIKRFAMEKKKAFTLIEVMGVLVIIGILTVILISVVNNIVKNNKKDLYNKQIESIRLAAKNLASDNMYILPEEEGEEIYITLGQLRAKGYAEEKIINPKTKENFPDSLIVMIIKKGNDYNYDIILNGDVVIVDSDVQVTTPSKKYIKEGIKSSYIITAKTDKEIGEKKAEYYIDIREENINLLGAVDKKVKYKVEGNNGLYKLTVIGGEVEGSLYFNFKELKDIEGKEVNVTDINNEMNDVSKNKQIIVDNTAPTCSWSGENETWTNNQVSIILTGLDNYKMNSSKSVYTKTYNQSGIEIATDNLSYEIEDEAGNKNICSKSANVYYDKKGPELDGLKNNSNGNWTRNNFNVSYNVKDSGSGYDYCEYNYDYDVYGSCGGSSWCLDSGSYSNGTFTASFSAERNTNSNFRCYDKLGNVSNVISTPIKIDKTKPSMSVSVGNCSNNKRIVSISASDSASGIAGYAITTSSGTPSSFSSSSSWSYSPGVYYAWVKDVAGNINNATVTVTDCITSKDICAATSDSLFGSYKGEIAGNYGNKHTGLNFWCRNGDGCIVTEGYERKCTSSLCNKYNIYGWTAERIDNEHGCSFSRYWCSC